MRRIALLLCLLVLVVPGAGRADGSRSAPWPDASTTRSTREDGLGYSSLATDASASGAGSIHVQAQGERSSVVGYSLLTDEAQATGTIDLGPVTSATGKLELRVHMTGSATGATTSTSIGWASVNVWPLVTACSFAGECFGVSPDALLSINADPLSPAEENAVGGSFVVDVPIGGSFGCMPFEVDVTFGIQAITRLSGAAAASASADFNVEAISWSDVPCVE